MLLLRLRLRDKFRRITPSRAPERRPTGGSGRLGATASQQKVGHCLGDSVRWPLRCTRSAKAKGKAKTIHRAASLSRSPLAARPDSPSAKLNLILAGNHPAGQQVGGRLEVRRSPPIDDCRAAHPRRSRAELSNLAANCGANKCSRKRYSCRCRRVGKRHTPEASLRSRRLALARPAIASTRRSRAGRREEGQPQRRAVRPEAPTI